MDANQTEPAGHHLGHLRELRAVHPELVSERPSSGKSDAEAG